MSDAAEGQELKISHEAAPGGCVLRLSGCIDLNFPRQRLVDLAKGVVVFDLNEVKRITSYGVREWMKSLKELTAEYYCYVNCRPAVIMQFNMMANFAQRGELLSFYLPYVCGSCGEYTDVLLDLRKQHQEVKSFSPPAVMCSACSAETEFDDSPQSYFSFAAKARVPSPPPLVDALLSGKAKTGAPLSVHKDIQEEITAFWISGTLDKTAHFKRMIDGLEGSVVVIGEEISHLDEQGLGRLRVLLDAPGVDIYLARVPPMLAGALLKDSKSRGRAVVVSVCLPARCTECTLQAFCEVDGETLDAVQGDGATGLCCRSCAGPMSLESASTALENARSLQLALSPENVRKYLSLNQRAPEADGAGSPANSTADSSTFGRYKLIRQLGTGGMAEVFLARQVAVAGFEKKVVLKRILPHLSTDQAFISMFLDEARLAARISHPNVTQIFDLGQEGSGQFFMAMEYVKGWDLNVVLKVCMARKEPLPLHLATRVVAGICAGLHAAHTCTDEAGKPVGIIHRDVSPHNVLVSTDGQIKLTDFGIAKAADTSSRTPVNTLKGKLAYMAPEQGKGDNTPLDGRADIFPAGLILYLCLTLEHVFQREGDFATLNAIMRDPIPRIAVKLPNAPPLLQEIIDRALARNRDERYPTASAFQDDLERLLVVLGKPASAADLSVWLSSRMPPLEELTGMTPVRGTQTFMRTPVADP